MKGYSLILLLTMLAVATAMVSKDRRALLSEELTTLRDVKYCDLMTPCAWSVYNKSRYIELNVTNSYCSCRENTVCRMTEDDEVTSAYIYRCRDPNEYIELDS